MSIPLKDMHFQPSFFEDLAAALKHVYPAFDQGVFLARALDDDWEARALKARIRHTTNALDGLLPDDYRAALDVLRAVVPALAPYGFEKMIFSDYVEVHGLDDWDASLPALEEFTRLISAEFAVRPFIIKDQDRMLAQMLRWASHDHEDVRRLASEGSRPRLPWAMALPALKADPSPIVPILDALKSDPSITVRRSVANNLNDISRDNPQVTLDVLRRWQADVTDSTQWITNHALRTLVKAGHPDALALLGYGCELAITVSGFDLSARSIPMGGAITFEFDITSAGDVSQDLIIDYVLHLKRARGPQTPKVFKITRRTLAPGETIHITRRFSFQPITTRTYYPGEHGIELQINGTSYGRRDFMVT
ncbi:MAG: DNA alkylation repair protein [Anaerolineae bacterium]|nr:DNA alkylation repair protein [Anaerolineae bacterium]